MTLPQHDAIYADHADYYQRGPYARYMTDRKLVGRAPVAMFAAEQPDGHFPDPALPNLLLYRARKGAREARFDWGAGRWRGTWRRDDLTLVPAGAASDVTLSDRHGFLGICLPVAMFATPDDPMGQATVDRFGSLYAAPFRDRLVGELCDTLWREGGDDGLGCGLFADSALQLLTDRLRHLAVASAPRPKSVTLSRRTLLRLDEAIRARLHERITVADLAAISGHSPSHFTAIFKRATGRTPYRHIMSMRIERAEDLIAARSGQGLADIALDCGFSSQSHMTAVFRAMTGRTPGQSG
ncbi:helix-turn-helix domain-containing protein [Roseovarius sp.]|uniref:helix-turn-helix domain-containing protein n=1 Tax=Roseovarius sp. TaxID=1486281 RepID=UPI003B58B9EC